MKKITIIDCYISSERVLSKLESMLNMLKNNGEDVLLMSNTAIPPHIQKLTNYSFYDENNRLFQDEYEDINLLDIWKSGSDIGIHELELSFQRHGLSVIINMFRCLEISKSLGYTHFQRLEVDDLFGPESIKHILNVPSLCIEQNKKALFYYNDYNNVKDFSFHYMFCEIDYFLNAVPVIRNESDYQNYLIKKYGKKKFAIVEQFLFDGLNGLNNQNILYRNGKDTMSIDFPDTNFNSETTECNISPKYKGCSSRIYRCKNCNPNESPAILTYNYRGGPCSRTIVQSFNDGTTKTLTHSIPDKGHYTYNVSNPNLEKISVFDEDKLLYEEDNKSIDSWIEFFIF